MIAVSLIVIDVTAGGAPELCEESVAAAMIHTNISDSVVANWIKLENWNQDRKNYLLQRPNRFKPVRTGPYRLSSYGGPRGPRRTVVQMSPPDTFCPKPFNSFIFSPAMTHSLWVTILIMTHFYNFDLVWPSGRAKLIYLTSFDLQGVTASQSQKNEMTHKYYSR